MKKGGKMSDPKGIALLIAEKNRPKEMMSEDEGDVGEMLDVAAEEVMAAIEAKDTEMLKEALKSFWEMC